jgi:hypothetical protein
MNKSKTWLRQFLKIFKEEIVFSAFVLLAIIIANLAVIWGEPSLWLSLAVIVVASLYYTTTFFNANDKLEKLFFFVLSQLFMILYFANLYKAVGVIRTFTGKVYEPNWVDAIYFSVVTWTTLGYGDFVPVDELKLFAICQALLGYIFMGLFVGKIIFLLSERKREKNNADTHN